MESLKQKIKKLRNNNDFYVKKNEFFDYIRAANEFRHSKNTENQLLAKYILKALLLNRNIDVFLKKIVYTYLGKIKSHNNQHERAIHKFQDGLNDCGDNARLYYFMGNNYAALERYDEAIQNWEKALAHVEKNDLEIKIKAHTRLLYCKEYHQKNAKTIGELYFKVIDLIQNNKVITDYKSLYKKLIMDFADYKTTNNCAAMFVFEKPRTNGSISKNMLNSLSGIHVKHKEAYGND
ncbi:MAG: tetratricopeptide repeat protein [Alphaproteobacteria bacterium]|nr:tetratricopeptide repeat protein [Alphaproteobacteria bacterium]